MLLPILALALLVLGITISSHALRHHGSGEGPGGPTMNVRYWKPIWRTERWFSSRKGFVLYLFGAQLAGLGGLIVAVFFLIK